MNYRLLLALIFLMFGCASPDFSETVEMVSKSSGAAKCTIGTEKFVNTEGTSTNKIKLGLYGIQGNQLDNKKSALEFLAQSAVFFYHNEKGKSDLNIYDGIEVRASNKQGQEHYSYFRIKSLEQVYHQMTLLESLIDEMNSSHKINWSNNLFHADLNADFKSKLDDFVLNELSSYGKIKLYYLLNFEILKSPEQKYYIIKYVCETELKEEFYMDFMFDQENNKIIGVLAHDGNKEFDF